MDSVILIVDKILQKSREIKKNLENNGYKVFAIGRLEEYEDVTTAGKVDLIIFYNIMDESINSGCNAALEETPKLGILVSSYKPVLSAFSKYLDDYIFEPYDDEELLLKVKNQLKIGSLQRQIRQKDAEIKDLSCLLSSTALVDAEIGIYNKNYLKSIMDKECANAKRYGNKLSGIVFCIDNDLSEVKNKNEIFKELVDLISLNIRQTDIFVRLTKDRFYILLPSTGLRSAVRVADKIRDCIMNHNFRQKENITISVGVSAYDEIDRGIKKQEEMLKQSGEALDRVVGKGGNKIECY